MEPPETITDARVPLLQPPTAPPVVLALVGELIAADGRFRSYSGGLLPEDTPDKFLKRSECYEGTVKAIWTHVHAFKNTKDIRALIQFLSDTRDTFVGN